MTFLLDLDPAGRRGRAIEDALRDAVTSGRLSAGTRLPSTRALASQLGCARATVVGAYEQLVAEGYLTATHGSGTAVATVNVQHASRDELAAARSGLFLGLLPGEPDPSSFPRAAWSASMRRILATSPDSVFTYGDPRGAPELRGALASYLARARAVATDPARIVIFNGFGSALSVLAATLRHLGVVRVALEDPCLPPLARIVDGAGLETVPVPVDDDGVRVDRLGGEGAILCTPAHQYPMGCSLSPSRRAALVRWARDSGGWILEDDYDGEFRYDRRPLGAMQGLDPDRVVYGGTASKSLAPGLQLGWLVLPAQLVDPVIATMRLRRVTVSTIEQLTLADFVQTGRLDKHLRRQRNIYRRRRDLLVRLLDERAPWLEVRGISAGLHVTALVADRDEQAIQAVAARHAAALFTIRDHVLDQQSAHGLVIGYSRPADHAFPDALARLRAILDDC